LVARDTKSSNSDRLIPEDPMSSIILDTSLDS
jgi:hypothetical protein